MQDKKCASSRKSNTAGVKKEAALEQESAAFQMLISVAGLKASLNLYKCNPKKMSYESQTRPSAINIFYCFIFLIDPTLYCANTINQLQFLTECLHFYLSALLNKAI